ncbi:MAG: hypothetical protein VX379_00270 [Pseudomonadota bacterium]|uniref:hypothetical protein n=1 Tax=Alcanivorax sp. TaxID=1872427 RepID=UPI00243B79B8|nr:hypothetical protein [Alcanivorax sp.]MED5237998.1 hypothetical protein [Pseudomonadota bacterium]MEE3319108.1 hypothetical protein [Pseudomonadota bacterium]
MLVYLLVACDGLDEKQEKKLKRAIPDVQTALQAFVAENASATLIEDCESDALADWQLGISQPISKKADLKPLVTLFNELATKHGFDCEAGSIEGGERDPVSYFGKHEGQGDAFLIAAYLGL